MSAPEIIALVLSVAVGAFLQGSIGFGIGMLAAPVVAFIDPTLVPATVLVLATVFTAVITIRDRASVNLRRGGWALLGRVPGTVVGAALVAVASESALALVVAGVVLGGVALSLIGWRPALRPRNLVIAGMVAGTSGTATSIGGPPMAIAFQRAEPAEVRGTLNAFFLVGSLVSLIALSLAGAVSAHSLQVAAMLLPALAVGYGAGRIAIRRLDRARLRLIAMAAATLSAVVLIAQQAAAALT